MFACIVHFSSRVISPSVRPLAGLLFAAVAHNAFAQWTYRVAPEPYIRNISFFTNTPVTDITTAYVSTLTDGCTR